MERYYALSGFIPNLYSLHAHSASLLGKEEIFHSSAVIGLSFTVMSAFWMASQKKKVQCKDEAGQGHEKRMPGSEKQTKPTDTECFINYSLDKTLCLTTCLCYLL